MENLANWEDQYLTGVAQIDNEHKRLFSVMRRMKKFFESDNLEQWRFGCKEGLKYLKSYAERHFAEEEEYMRSINYDGYSIHKDMHSEFKNNILPTLEQELDRNNYSQRSIQRFIGTTMGWLKVHIRTADMAIVGRNTLNLQSSAISIHSEDVEKFFVKLAQNVMSVPIKLVSRNHAVADIGKALYYDVEYYYPETGSRMNTLLGLSRDLILDGYSKMLGKKFDEINETVLSANEESIQMAMVFLESVFKPRSSANERVIRRIKMLDFEQFKQRHEELTPEISLLFHGDQGALLFGVRAKVKSLVLA